MWITRLLWRFWARGLVALLAAWYIVRNIDAGGEIFPSTLQSSIKLAILGLVLVAAIMILAKLARRIVSRLHNN